MWVGTNRTIPYLTILFLSLSFVFAKARARLSLHSLSPAFLSFLKQMRTTCIPAPRVCHGGREKEEEKEKEKERRGVMCA
jgi:hypothetical protein